MVSRACGASAVRLQHKYALAHEKAFINGSWRQSKSGATFPVFNPANGEVICNVTDCSSEDVEDAVEAAVIAFKSFKETTAKERSAMLLRFYELQNKHAEDLAKLMTAENGKPMVESRSEVVYGASFLEWFAAEARRMYGDYVPAPVKGREMVFIKQPVGVTSIITPWNFPNAMITRKIGAALAAGCTCIIKPAPETPLSALALAQLAHEAGFPPGTVNVLPSSAKNTPGVGQVLCKHHQIHALSFTGSSAIGKLLLAQCADSVKKVSLELGGNAPFIIFDSANLERAVNGALACKFRNTGQVGYPPVQACWCLSHAPKRRALQTKPCPRRVPGSCTGIPLENVQVEHHVADAVEKGGKVLVGGKRHALGGNFFEPTLVTHVNRSMLVCTEETFGPVASVIKFKTEEEAVELANSTRVGLAGYFYTENIAQGWRVAKALEVGMVGVNEGIISCAEAAFGGVKESGLGREGSRYGLDEFTHIKYICFGGLE
ncbi:hypothetical protein HPB49_007816 [Dermacentor silvarum]|uniref:Uncharacterized protein n=1 Tax=Dermacentor silvarum TaxID=543639 RepID=A0ACB8C861_DERSI|nr:hypothetical protein HPB49_007816 [Dermacentor silvarum]